MDNYIIVYDKLETTFNHYGLGVIRNTVDPGPRILERMNTEYTCEFTVPFTDESAKYLVEDNIVKVAGQLFIIRTVEDKRDQNNRLLTDVFAEHITTELLTEYIPFLQYSNAASSAIVSGVLAGTRFSGNATAVTSNHTFTITRNSAAWGIRHFIALSKAEMKRDNFNITFKPEIGQNIGVRVSYRKNLKTITRTKDSRNVITRLYVYGKDGVALPNPIDSPNISVYPRPKCGDVTFDEIEDLAALQAKGESYLATVDGSQLSYEVDVIELKNAEGYGESEALGLGDTVYIDDEDLGIAVTARIVEYEEYPFSPGRSRVTLANFLPNVTDTLAGINETVRTVDQVTTESGQISSSWIEGSINTLKNQLIASGTFASATVANGGFLLENTNASSPDYGALFLGPGIFAIASTQLNGEWQWRTFGKGSGFTADEIKAGIIQAERFVIGANTQYEAGYNPAVIRAELQAEIAAIEGGIDQAVIDGIIDETEANAIATYINQLNSDKADIDSKYTSVYNNASLGGTPKTNLANAKTAYNTAHTNIINSINSAIADNKVTPAEKTDIDSKFTAYRSSLSTLSTRFEEANNAIATNKANTAQSAAEAVAIAQSQLAQIQAEAYADGIVTAEEQARIYQANANLNAAKADATSKANAAETAAKNASVLKGVKYKSVYVDANGLHIDDATGEVVRMGEYEAGKFGVVGFHIDGSRTILTGSGLIRQTATGEKPYNYLVAAGTDVTGANGAYYVQASSTTGLGDGIPNKTITLPTDFRGKDFKVFVSLKRDSIYDQFIKNNSGGLRVIGMAPGPKLLEVVSINQTNGTFTVKGFGSQYEWDTQYFVSGSNVIPNYTNVVRKDYALDFTWIAIA